MMRKANSLIPHILSSCSKTAYLYALTLLRNLKLHSITKLFFYHLPAQYLSLLTEGSSDDSQKYNQGEMLSLLRKNELIRLVTQDTKWLNTVLIIMLHIALAMSFVMLCNSTLVHTYTVLFGFFVGGLSGFGVTGGAHRLWTHRSYKAKLPLRIILIICYAIAGQNPLFDWVRDHRVHHKYSETDADPHNANRGFFFAHVGWLMKPKHPEVIRKGNTIYMDDILEDPVVVFHQKYFWPMKMLCCFIIPTAIPTLLWNEYWGYSFLSQGVVRYCLSLNFTWLVNSAAHLWGNKPYDRKIMPAENPMVSLLAMGEGWHNYHHVFPWDYRTGELGSYSGYTLNITTLIIDLFAKIGWAYELKAPDPELIRRIVEKKGDGSHGVWGDKSKIGGCNHPVGPGIEVWETENIVKKSKASGKIEEIKEEQINNLLMKS